MSSNKTVDNYNLLDRIEEGLEAIGKTPENVTIEDLAPVDEFHVGGLDVVKPLVRHLQVGTGGAVVDLGSGSGGPARFIARETGAHVQGIDLSQEAVETGNELSKWTGFSDQVALDVGDACATPYETARFDAAIFIHVHMFLEEPQKLYDEAFRLLRSGGRFVVFDPVMRTKEGFAYPVPWAADAATDNICDEGTFKSMAVAAGFNFAQCVDCNDIALQWFEGVFQRAIEAGGLPPLGPHLVAGPDFPLLAMNAYANLQGGQISMLQLVFTKP